VIRLPKAHWPPLVAYRRSRGSRPSSVGRAAWARWQRAELRPRATLIEMVTSRLSKRHEFPRETAPTRVRPPVSRAASAAPNPRIETLTLYLYPRPISPRRGVVVEGRTQDCCPGATDLSQPVAASVARSPCVGRSGSWEEEEEVSRVGKVWLGEAGGIFSWKWPSDAATMRSGRAHHCDVISPSGESGVRRTQRPSSR
jgi:hypothetical protein